MRYEGEHHRRLRAQMSVQERSRPWKSVRCQGLWRTRSRIISALLRTVDEPCRSPIACLRLVLLRNVSLADLDVSRVLEPLQLSERHRCLAWARLGTPASRAQALSPVGTSSFVYTHLSVCPEDRRHVNIDMLRALPYQYNKPTA
jgi:hypothetical protein